MDPKKIKGVEDAEANKKLDEETTELDTFGNDATEELIDEGDAPKFIDPRAVAMAEMVANSKQARAASKQEHLEETGYDPDELVASEEYADEEYTDEGDVDEGAADGDVVDEEIVDNSGQTSDNPVIAHDGQQFIKLKVNGVEQEMSLADAQAQLQKGLNADQMMQQAAQTRKVYEDLIAQQQAQTPSTPPDETPQATVNTDEVLKGALSKMYDGDVDEAAAELAPLFQQAQPQQAPQVDVAELVDQRLAAQADHNNLQSAYDRFRSNEEFGAIVDDPVLLAQVNTVTEQLQHDAAFLATNPSYDDFLNEAGKQVNTWVESITPKQEPAPEPEVDKRVARKRGAPSQPESRTVRRSPKPEAKPKGRHDILADMAAARGQRNFN